MALAPDYISKLTPYTPGSPIREAQKAYGLTSIMKLASNENAFGPSPKAMAAIYDNLGSTNLYPIEERMLLKERLVNYLRPHKLTPANIALANGSNELISLLMKTFVGEGEALVNAWPSFVCYRLAARFCNRQEIVVPLTEGLNYDLGLTLQKIKDAQGVTPKIFFIANPNNPTGQYVTRPQLENFLLDVPDELIVVLDEAYFEYVYKDDYPDGLEWALKRPRTLVLRTFSKIFGLAGLRIGYAVGDPEMINILHKTRDPFNVNNLAQVGAMAALNDREHLELSWRNNLEQMPIVTKALNERNIQTWPSVGNFLLAKLPDNAPSMPWFYSAMVKKGVIIRPVENYELRHCFRVTIGQPLENHRFLKVLDEVLDDPEYK